MFKGSILFEKPSGAATVLGGLILSMIFFQPCAIVYAQWRLSHTSPPAVLTFSDSANGLMIGIEGACFITNDAGHSWDSLLNLDASFGAERSQFFYSRAPGQGDDATRDSDIFISGDSLFGGVPFPVVYRLWGQKMFDSLYGFRFVEIMGGSAQAISAQSGREAKRLPLRRLFAAQQQLLRDEERPGLCLQSLRSRIVRSRHSRCLYPVFGAKGQISALVREADGTLKGA